MSKLIILTGSHSVGKSTILRKHFGLSLEPRKDVYQIHHILSGNKPVITKNQYVFIPEVTFKKENMEVFEHPDVKGNCIITESPFPATINSIVERYKDDYDITVLAIDLPEARHKELFLNRTKKKTQEDIDRVWNNIITKQHKILAQFPNHISIEDCDRMLKILLGD